MIKKGIRKENYLTEKMRGEGFDIVQRSAGSHSPVDIFAIDSKNKKILLIQSKRTMSEYMSYTDPKIKEKLEKQLGYLNGVYSVEFIVM